MFYVIPTFILGVATLDDIMKRKVHNALFLFCVALAVGHVLYFAGTSGLPPALLGAGLAFLLTFPLFMMKALGGGDVKIFVAFGFASNFSTVLSVFVYSLFWGSLLGILMVLMNKEIKIFSTNLIHMLTFKSAKHLKTHKIPFTFALLAGWISHLIVAHYGRVL